MVHGRPENIPNYQEKKETCTRGGSVSSGKRLHESTGPRQTLGEDRKGYVGERGVVTYVDQLVARRGHPPHTTSHDANNGRRRKDLAYSVCRNGDDDQASF